MGRQEQKVFVGIDDQLGVLKTFLSGILFFRLTLHHDVASFWLAYTCSWNLQKIQDGDRDNTLIRQILILAWIQLVSQYSTSS